MIQMLAMLRACPSNSFTVTVHLLRHIGGRWSVLGQLRGYRPRDGGPEGLRVAKPQLASSPKNP
ncbi:hypothetical protein [Bosea psychrotolerans]|uniref:hypothetical protein n=1 Tax=Bosea psychrotolerans TaxID=1871628 RepID=UPI001AECF79E|nr:hypothetical protein [Bosea psychrotolerans]